MNYRVTCETPVLVGDGQKLAPVDYMVWRDHVNVLDQRRIFKLLAKGPRLDGYLAQLKKADKLDFASWGGFAQNFAGRRIPFEHASSIHVWEKARAEQLFIPTFAADHRGPYLPATALKGALRTGSVHARWSEGTMRHFAERLGTERMPRNPAIKLEDGSQTRKLSVGDSGPISVQSLKIYLVRTSTVIPKGQDRVELGWKPDITFAEMAAPGTQISGVWSESSQDRGRVFQAANRYAAAQLASHLAYAQRLGLADVALSAQKLLARIESLGNSTTSCLLSIGWGGGFLSKAAFQDTQNQHFRGFLKQVPAYNKALSTGLPFPKTRRIVFEGGRPSTLGGWVLLEVQ